MPDEAGIGEAPHSIEKEASERSRSPLSPAAKTRVAATSWPTPNSWRSCGTSRTVRASSSFSSERTSWSSTTYRRHIERRDSLGRGRVGRSVDPISAASPDQSWRLQVAQLFANGVGRHHDETLHRVHRLSSRLDCSLLGDLERSDHLHAGIAGLGYGCGPAREHRTRSCVGVDGIGLASKASIPAHRTEHLDNRLALGAEKSGQTSAVTAGALNAKRDDWPEFLCPRQKAGVAAWVGFDLELAEVAAQSIFRSGDMRVLVGVDSYGHVWWNVCDTQCCHRPPLLDGFVVGSRARGHYCDGALTSLLSGHCSLGAVFLRWSLTSRRQIEIRARGLYSEGSTLWQQPPVWIFAEFRIVACRFRKP